MTDVNHTAEPLRSCPFCGFEALMIREVDGDEIHHRVRCANRSCRAEQYLQADPPENIREATAIRAWNTRHPLAGITDPVAAVEKARTERARLLWALKDTLSACAYIEQGSGRIYGIGWDRLESYRREFVKELAEAQSVGLAAPAEDAVKSPMDLPKKMLIAGLISGALSQEQIIADLRAERDAAVALLREVHTALMSHPWGLHDEPVEAERDALIARIDALAKGKPE